MDVEALVAAARARRPQPMDDRERVFAAAMALVFLGGCALVAFTVKDGRSASPLTLAVLVVAYAVVWRIPFEIGRGTTDPTVLVFIPMLFVAPIRLVPLLVAGGMLLARAPEFVLGRVHVDRWLWCLGNSLEAIAPALVIGLLAPGPLALRHAPVYILAIAIEHVVIAGYAAASQRILDGEPVKATLRLYGWSARVDLALTPVAYVVAIGARHSVLAVVAILPLAWVLSAFSQERSARYTATLELNQAYRGTVMVLADVLEQEDDYTAYHCRSVVELAVSVGKELGVGTSDIHELEMVALMHDIGKIAIPNEILNKPAKLTADEFELMKTHTIEGQALLARVGGRLARIGSIVRSCHERWDGGGYPDGLAGEQIPLAARIVFCCDAFSAMTTDRPYRRAMPPEAALEELAANSATQFEPRIVDAVTRVVRQELLVETECYTEAVRAVLASRPSTTSLDVELST